MVIFYKKWKKYNEIQLRKNTMDLNIRKMINHPPVVSLSARLEMDRKVCPRTTTSYTKELFIRGQNTEVTQKLRVSKINVKRFACIYNIQNIHLQKLLKPS